MKRMLAPLLTAVVLAALLPGSASAATPTLAVTYFDNNTSEERFDPLGRGLADMLITDLSVVENLTVVERGRLNDVLSELELQSSSFVDPETAVTVGKGVGAQYVLTGAFLAVEPQMRIDARIVNVSTGEVVQADSVTGPVDEFFLLEKELAGSIVERLGISVSSRESARMGRVATENFEAFVAYSEGLTYEVERIGGMKSTFLSGEGLISRIRGQGTVLVQSRSPGAFASWIRKYIPSK